MQNSTMSPHVEPAALSDGAIHDMLQDQSTCLLGEGGSCSVFLVNYKGASRCLKVSTLKGNTAFLREASTLLALDGAGGAPRLLGVSDGKGQELALLTTYCGEHTFDDLPRLAPTDAKMLRAFLDLCRALQQVHARGVVHNDIKANNVVVRLDPDNGRLHVSLIDYGLARGKGLTLFHEPYDHSLAPWMAPEELECEPCQPAGDVYSLACLLDEILYSCTALYPDLMEVVLQALSPSPEERPSVRAVAKAVQRCLSPPRRSFGSRLRSFFGGLKNTFGSCLPLRSRGRGNTPVSWTVSRAHANASVSATNISASETASSAVTHH
ncbi:serine/threonine-protein kinase pim-2-like [Eriocheir sinensis]|uniref:serine/threonine-protein kinase pim-2-like n=1 Tax=Eriocheir sinensis TaxID=95602 RepID=UPI0021C9022D|nr:serine/threonine-protein kinase pim-2-like [Eriocheir sinensis]